MENDITWEIGSEIIERDPEERLTIYRAEGLDKSGNKYLGSAEFVCGEFEGIKDIEEV